MGKTRENDVLELIELILQRGFNARIIVAEQINPPGTYAIQIAPPIKIVQPYTIAALNGDQRQLFVRLHLRAGVPHGFKAAMQVILVLHGSANG